MNIRHLKKSLLAFNIVMTALLLYQAVIVFQEWKTGNQPGSASEASVAKAGRAAPNADRQQDRPATYQAIVNRDIFGTTPSQRPVPPPAVPEQEEIVPTQLKLRLNGTMVGDRQAYAVIADLLTRKEGIYTSNDTIQNATIVEIFSDRIVLDVNGRKEALILFPEHTPTTNDPTGIRRRFAPGNRTPGPRRISGAQRSTFRIPSSR